MQASPSLQNPLRAERRRTGSAGGRKNAGRSSCAAWCAVPIDEAVLQQQELDSELVLGSSHPSASARKCSWRSVFAPFLRVFSKRTNRTVFLRFPAGVFFWQVFNVKSVPICLRQPTRLNVILFASPGHSRTEKVSDVSCSSRGLRRAPVSDEAPR